ncbi:MAG: ECF transporter S component [Clostridia bacterium]
MRLTTRRLVVTGMLAAISIILGLTPIGLIPLPFSPTKATIMHIPVIIGSIVEGPIVGLIIGLIFGGFSMYQAATMATNPAQFVFLDPMVAILPRMLIAITSYYAYKSVKAPLKRDIAGVIAGMVAAAVGTLTNTVGVLLAIYLRHGVEYAEKLGIAPEAVGGVLMGIAVTHGIPEIIVAVLIVTAVLQVLQRIYRKAF